MIVRILEDGQYELDAQSAVLLEKLDLELDRTIREHDERGFATALAAVISEVHASASKLGADALVPSELTVPAAGSSLDEVRRILDEGAGEA